MERAGCAILALGTAVPPYRIDQASMGKRMSEALSASPGLARWIKRLYELSSIETRYSCLPDAEMTHEQSRFSPGRPISEVPTTFDRMQAYRHSSGALGAAAARRALEELAGDQPFEQVASSITHIIAVSCTGFFAPGLDQAIARQLGLGPRVERTLVGFMGCAACFNALRLAEQIVRGQPEARVLVVCVELCSLHVQPGSERTNLIVASLFADGAAACVVGAPGPAGAEQFDLNGFYTGIEPDTDHEMVWDIGNTGFELYLSPDIPRKLADVAPRALDTLLNEREQPAFWAIHPGGRAIVDKLAEIFSLSAEQVAPSLDILRRYGNMSSPTILFVLNEQRERLRRVANQPVPGVAMAFGPGLVTEMAHLTYQPGNALSVLNSEAAVEMLL